jgi:muramoyltetrapeptide carboxypeptidase
VAVAARGADRARPAAATVRAGERPETAQGAGRARGVLLGGNLTLVDALYRSAWMPTLRGALLLLEDVGEALYRLDRMLTSLEGRGAAQEVEGVVLGSFTDCGGLTQEEAADEVVQMLSGWGVPVYRGLAVGHMHPQRSCWLGRPATLDPARGLIIDEGDG